MTWFKVDDELHDHRKVRHLERDRLAAMGLWVLSGSWSADTGSDGFVPRGGLISGTYNFDTQITCNVRFDGETPTVGGAEILQQPMQFKCVGNTSASAITLLYRTTDTMP